MYGDRDTKAIWMAGSGVTLDEASARKYLELLRTAILSIYASRPLPLSYQEYYRTAYELVTHAYSHTLYRLFCGLVIQELKKIVVSLLGVDDSLLLPRLVQTWHSHFQYNQYFHDILIPLDGRLPKSMPIVHAGNRLFAQYVVAEPRLRARLVQLIPQLFAARLGDASPILDHLKQFSLQLRMTDLHSKLRLHSKLFVQGYLTFVRGHYRALAERAARALAVPAYLERVAAWKARELRQAFQFLPASALLQLNQVLGQILVLDHLDFVLQDQASGAMVMFEAMQLAHLHQLYCQLTTMVKSRHALSLTFARWVVLAVSRVFPSGRSAAPAAQARTTPASLLQQTSSLLKCVQDMNRIVSEAFWETGSGACPELSPDPDSVDGGDGGGLGCSPRGRLARGTEDTYLRLVLDNTLAKYFSECTPVLIKGLALLLDRLLRPRLPIPTPHTASDRRAVLKAFVYTFNLVSDKDLLLTLAQRSLARRLVSRDAELALERDFLEALGQLQDTDTLRALRHMLQDATKSLEFCQHMHARAASDEAAAAASAAGDLAGPETFESRNLILTIATPNYWPFSHAPPATIPPALAPTTDLFTASYLEAHPTRRLYWHAQAGHALVTFWSTPRRATDLVVSSLQILVLLCFAAPQVEELSLETIQSSLGVPYSTLHPAISALVQAPRIAVLTSGPAPDTAQPTLGGAPQVGFAPELAPTLRPVSNYPKRARAVVFPPRWPMTRPSAPDSSAQAQLLPSAAAQKVQQDRRVITEAALVRIIKARRTLETSTLIANCATQVSRMFSPSVDFIRHRIEYMIQTGYFKRDDDTITLLHYIA